MHIRNKVIGIFLPASAAMIVAIALTACSDRRPTQTTPPVTTAPTAPTAPTVTTGTSSSSSGPVIAPSTATDVVTKKGTETGMVGGESGTVAASGKPGTGTASGAGTGAAVASDEKTTNKK